MGAAACGSYGGSRGAADTVRPALGPAPLCPGASCLWPPLSPGKAPGRAPGPQLATSTSHLAVHSPQGTFAKIKTQFSLFVHQGHQTGRGDPASLPPSPAHGSRHSLSQKLRL